MKLQKIEEHGVESSGTTSATEESVLELVASRDGVSRRPNILSEAQLETHVVPVVLCLSADGSICFQVLLDDVVKHFNGSKRESVVEILVSLESEFEIYKKNGKYMIM
jgi:ATP-dependent DNA helicase RecQ